MPWQRQARSAGRLASKIVVVGLLVGAGVLSANTMLARKDKGVSRHPVASDRPAGLVQAGDSKTACIYAGLGATLLRAERATGITYNCIETYSDADPTWAGWVNPWVIQPQFGYRGWLTADPTGRTIILTQNLIPDSEDANPSWRAQGAAGDFNGYARMLALNLVKAGFGYSVIRLGHEMNGNWENDNVGDNLTQWHQWAAFFAQTVKTMRSVKGAHFLFDWNVNAATWTTIPIANYYPGNTYVDIIGISAYDDSGYPLPAVGSPGRWQALASESLGLYDVYAFAQAHNRPLSIPEWGTLSSMGDDGEYVTAMGNFVASHDVAYQCWFDDGNGGINQLSNAQAPQSVAAYVRTISLSARSGLPKRSG